MIVIDQEIRVQVHGAGLARPALPDGFDRLVRIEPRKTVNT